MAGMSFVFERVRLLTLLAFLNKLINRQHADGAAMAKFIVSSDSISSKNFLLAGCLTNLWKLTAVYRSHCQIDDGCNIFLFELIQIRQRLTNQSLSIIQ